MTRVKVSMQPGPSAMVSAEPDVLSNGREPDTQVSMFDRHLRTVLDP
jgi:hypothetical protein